MYTNTTCLQYFLKKGFNYQYFVSGDVEIASVMQVKSDLIYSFVVIHNHTHLKEIVFDFGY